MAIPQAPIGSGFGAASTIAEVIAGRDLTGKTNLVSGGYSGMGVETERAFCTNLNCLPIISDISSSAAGLR